MGWLFTRMDTLLTLCVSRWQARQAVKVRPSAVFSSARASLSNANSTGTDATSVRTRSGGDAHEMTPMAALVFTATFALIIWIPSFSLTARVYPPNEGKDLPKQRKIFPRVHFFVVVVWVTTWDALEWHRVSFLIFQDSAKRNYNIFLRKSLWRSPSVCGSQIRSSNGTHFFFIKRSLISDSVGSKHSNFVGTIFFIAPIFIYLFLFHEMCLDDQNGNRKYVAYSSKNLNETFLRLLYYFYLFWSVFRSEMYKIRSS